MKKFLATLALVVALCGSMVFAACFDNGSNNTNDGDDQKQEQPNDNKPENPGNTPGGNENDGGVKIEGTITRGTNFSNGLALVQTNDKSKASCINKDEYIVFELDVPSEYSSYIDPLNLEFIGGYILIPWSGALYDSKGNATYPEDVGATAFYDIALEGGYILADKVTASFSNTKKELGVMNTDFEWVIEPSEEIFQAIAFRQTNTIVSSSLYYFDDYIYSDDTKVYFNLKTGEFPKRTRKHCRRSYGRFIIWAMCNAYMGIWMETFFSI